MRWLRRALAESEPISPESRAALRQRWEELPEHIRTPSQVLGRAAFGCEGTHGVFPRCNFVCTPCYHSADANHVRVDGAHTLQQIREQMELLRELRGPHGHTQLIGGEVSLLDPDSHAEALATIRSFGREPMSFTHGDFDYDYLERLALGHDGQPRLQRLSFSAHFDMNMFGRRGLKRPATEAALNAHRQRFCAMFRRLRREHGIRSYLAHSMTITPRNVDQIPRVIRSCHGMGFNMFSFQPAAFVGDARRWKEDYTLISADEVWRKIEEGAGNHLPHKALQIGDDRCNRVAFGFYLGERWYPIFVENDLGDLAVRDAFFEHLGGMHFNAPLRLFLPRLLRVVVAHPRLLALGLGWLRRAVVRVGGVGALLRNRPVPMTFVMHRFMHGDDVRPAWELSERGVVSDDPRIRETQERLDACFYAMAHPETRRLVPACVQHAVLDPLENAALRQLLPLPRSRRLLVDAGAATAGAAERS